jgi:leucyl aminopeptidase
VEVFDEQALAEMGCGGLLGVNAGSAKPPRLIKLTYQPAEPTGQLAMVGKGIMYDSGGIGLKPNNRVHAQMKNDMTGAAAILAAMAALDQLGCRTRVTGYLMCTDNMPSGTAMALGDVISVRGGTTVEVLDSDAEGRLVLSDGLVLAAEQGNDAIVDIATLTGSCLRALGPDLAGVFGNDQALVEQVKQAAEATDEPVWQLPLHRRYGEDLYTGVADLRNIGADAVPDSIVAALFLSHFVGRTPWAHIDICGPAQNDSTRGWRTEGCSGFGARLLLELALNFSPTPTSRV